jgi:hypothetical protein
MLADRRTRVQFNAQTDDTSGRTKTPACPRGELQLRCKKLNELGELH